jgi:hypothetical protein
MSEGSWRRSSRTGPNVEAFEQLPLVFFEASIRQFHQRECEAADGVGGYRRRPAHQLPVLSEARHLQLHERLCEPRCMRLEQVGRDDEPVDAVGGDGDRASTVRLARVVLWGGRATVRVAPCWVLDRLRFNNHVSVHDYGQEPDVARDRGSAPPAARLG